jgi:integrase
MEARESDRPGLTKSALKKGRPMSDWVFPSRVGAPLEPNRVREAFFLALKHAKLRRIRFHDMRHTFASWLIANGESQVYVKEQLGHLSIQITVDAYGHLIPGANRKAVNALDDSGWNVDATHNMEAIDITREIAIPAQ